MRPTTIACLLPVVVLACGEPEPPRPGEPVTFQTICTDAYNAKMDRSGLTITKRVTLEGYLGLGDSTMCSDTCRIELFEDAGLGGRSISLYVKIGSGNNQMTRLTRETLKARVLEMRANDGTKLAVGSRVRVTGGRLGEDTKVCAITDVDLIEPIGSR